MKSLLLCVILFLSISIVSSCSKENLQGEIIGNWQLDSERIITNETYLGQASSPDTVKFPILVPDLSSQTFPFSQTPSYLHFNGNGILYSLYYLPYAYYSGFEYTSHFDTAKYNI